MANLVGHETRSKITGLFCKEPYQRDSILQKRPMILRSLLIYFHETSRNTLKSALYHLENFSKISSISFCVVSIAASCRLRNVRAAFQVDSLKRQLALILHFFFFLVWKYVFGNIRLMKHMCELPFEWTLSKGSLLLRFFWWVLQHCTGFARLVWGRLRVHRAFIYSNCFVCSVCFC